MKIQFDTASISKEVWWKYIMPLSRVGLVAFSVGSAASSIHNDLYFLGGFWVVASIGSAIWAICTTVAEQDERYQQRRNR